MNSNVFSLADGAVQSGCVIALALICLAQYGIHMYRMLLAERQKESFRRELAGLTTELDETIRERELSDMEIHILREFVSQTELERSLDLLLKRYVPSPQNGFGAFLLWDAGSHQVARSRGLSNESLSRLQISEPILNQIYDDGVVTISGYELVEHPVPTNLTAADRGKVKELFLIAIAEGERRVGVMIATSLFPSDAPFEQQASLVQRLMQTVAHNIQRAQDLVLHQNQLRQTTEMLALRSITDQQYDTPLTMISRYLEYLCENIQAHRAVLFLFTQESNAMCKALVRAGRSLKTGTEQRWQEFENQLAELTGERSETLRLNQAELHQNQIDRLINSAMLIPLIQDDRVIGTICFTSDESRLFDENHERLACWAAEHLTGTIHRVLNQAVVQRQAREDGLTELANRRAFDLRMRKELDLARENDSQLALLMFDLDRFKSINDTYGHQAGDFVLKRTAQILREKVGHLRAGDRALLARYGGEEMAVALPDFNLPGGLRIAELLRDAIEREPFEYQGQRIHVTASVGLAIYPNQAVEMEDLVEAADAALYEAKTTGRNKVVCAAPVDAMTVQPSRR